MNWKLLLSLLLAILVFGGLGWLLTRGGERTELPDQIVRSAEGTNIPATARPLDGYAFVDESGVYLRSAFSTSTMRIPEADPESFRVVSTIAEYTNQEIQDFCKGPGNFGVYADKKKGYMFQFWKTPTFSKTRIEVIQGMDPDTLTVSGNTLTSGTTSLRLGYEFATTTCTLTLEPVQ